MKGVRTSRQLGVGVATASAVLAMTLLLLTPGVVGANVLRATGANVVPNATASKCAVGTSPEQPAYDPVNHDIYVPNHNSGNISVKSTTCKNVGSVPLPSGAKPVGAVFNPQDNEVWVTDNGLNQVYLISGLGVTHTVTSSYFSGLEPPAWDPSFHNAGGVILPSANNGYVWGIVSSGTGGVGYSGFASPYSVLYDPSIPAVVVGSAGSPNVTYLDPVNLGPIISNGTAGSGMFSMAFDAANNYDYVANGFSSNVTVLLDGATIGSVAVTPGPTGVVYDEKTQAIYVMCSSKMYELQGLTVIKTVSFGSGGGVYAGAYSDLTDKVYIVDFSNDVLDIHS